MNSIKHLMLCLVMCMTSLAVSNLSQAVVVHDSDELAQAIAEANQGGDKTILLEDGLYRLDDMLWVQADGVHVGSVSGNREAVVVEGEGMNGPVTHIFNVAGNQFCVEDMTLRRVSQHAIQFQPEADSPSMQNLHVLDTGEQMIKIAYYPGNPSVGCDGGILEESLLEYSAGIGPQWYIGGIDAHNAKDWIVRDNTFVAIRSPSQDIAEHAIHFWSDSENTLVERNLIINCDRGIGFGLGDRGHHGGIIRNNMIYHDSEEGYADLGISLESAPGAQVYNNTVYFEHSYPHAIEFRFPATTDVLIVNNLTNRAIVSRDGASGSLSHNVTNATADWLVDPSTGDLHLSGEIPTVVDQGQSIIGLTDDFDKDSRPQGSGIDIGADELCGVSSVPVPDIKANGLDGPVTVSQDDPVTLTVSLEPNDYEGVPADWWVVALTPFGPYSYVHPTGWQTGVIRCVAASIMELEGVSVFSGVLPTGGYTVYFALNDNVDGNLDGTWVDSVEITVQP